MTGLNGSAGGAYLENEPRFVCAIDPRRIRLVAGLRYGFDAPDNPSRTQRPTDPTRVHTGIVGRTSTNERWQAEDCGRQMTDKHPKRPRDLKGLCVPKTLNSTTVVMQSAEERVYDVVDAYLPQRSMRNIIGRFH